MCHACVWQSSSFLSLYLSPQAHCHAGAQVTGPVVTHPPDGRRYLPWRWLMMGVWDGRVCMCYTVCYTKGGSRQAVKEAR